MLYIDSSALLKLLWQEPESEAVRDHVASEDIVIVSSLTELETYSSSPRPGSRADMRRPGGNAFAPSSQSSGPPIRFDFARSPAACSRRPCDNISAPAGFSLARWTGSTWPP